MLHFSWKWCSKNSTNIWAKPRKVKSQCKQRMYNSSCVLHVLRQCVVYKPYQLQLAQALCVGDTRKHVKFCNYLLTDMEMTEFYAVDFCDEAMFHVSSKVNCHNVCIRTSESSLNWRSWARFTKSECFCINSPKIYGPSFFDENTVTEESYLNMLQTWNFTTS